MEHGFWHPSRGYWQTIGMPDEDMLAGYPEGTVETPLRPGPDHVWTDGVWVYTPPPVTREQALSALKARRDEAMCAGIEVNGVPVQTDDLSQQRLTAAALAAQLDPESTVRWKTAGGAFVVLSAAQIVAIALAVRSHVQRCFDREAELKAAIETADDPGSVDISDPSLW